MSLPYLPASHLNKPPKEVWPYSYLAEYKCVAPTAAASIFSVVQLKQSFVMFLSACVEFIVYITSSHPPSVPLLLSVLTCPSTMGGAQYRPQCNTRTMLVKTLETQWESRVRWRGSGVLLWPGHEEEVLNRRLKGLCHLNFDSLQVIH